MAKKTEIKEQKGGVVALVEDKVKSLKEIGKGEQGQYINLADIEGTKGILKNLSTKYKDLEVTKENYKTVAKQAERELRESRYALQRVNKGNTSFLNDIKKREKKLYEELIDIIRPQEERLYKAIAIYKEAAKRAKEEEERKEKERIEKIENALKEAELSLEKAFIQAKTDDDLVEYDKFLEDLKASFESFEEREFDAKRIHAIYTAKRNSIIVQIEQYKKLQKEKAEAAERERKAKEQKQKVYEARQKKLIKLGFKMEDGVIVGFGISTVGEDLKELDEVSWYKFLDGMELHIEGYKLEEEKKAKEEKQKKEQEEREKLLDARKMWEELLETYKGLGGDPKLFKLRKNQIPSKKDIDSLTKATKELHKEKREVFLNEVKAEIEPFKDKVLELLKQLEAEAQNTEFKHEQSEGIVSNFIGRGLEVVNEVFGVAYNK